MSRIHVHQLLAVFGVLGLLAVAVNPGQTSPIVPAQPIVQSSLGQVPVQQAKEPSIVGTWYGRYKVGTNIWFDIRTTLRADGTFLTVRSTLGQVVAERGTYTYADGIMGFIGEGSNIELQATITWTGPNQFVFRGLGAAIQFTRG